MARKKAEREEARKKAEEEKGPNMQTVKEKMSAKRNERDELIRKKPARKRYPSEKNYIT